MNTVDLWRVTLVADAVSQAAYAAALEEVAASLSAFETAPGGPWRIEALLTAEPDRGAVVARLAAAAASIGRTAPSPVIERMPDIDWVAENRRAFPPLRVGRFFVYGSHYQGQIPAGARAITLDAGMAFGSGEHATTRGCLLALDTEAKRRRIGRALDVGCGSGILAIAMAKTWPAVRPAGIVATDIDPDSVRIARENVQRNRVARAVRVHCSNGLSRIRRRRGYDAVVANILANPLRRLAGDISRAARPGGIVVLSGLLGSQENEVRAAYRARGLVFVGRLALDGWHTLVLRRPKRGRHQTAAASR